MRLKTCLSIVFVLSAFAQFASPQSSLAPRVLVVYNSADPGSNAVATHYQAARGVPAANMCSVPAVNNPTLTAAEYISTIRNPVRTCLNAVGRQNILYILLAYLRPISLDVGSGRIYSIDSYLSDIWDQYTTKSFYPVPPAAHRYYADSQSQGNVFPAFQSLANYRASSRSQLIYSVWRLDGTTTAIANAQVDNALAATGGPVSKILGSLPNACIDQTYAITSQPDSGYATANWDLQRAAEALGKVNKFSVVVDSQSTSFGVSPSLPCPNTGLYVGWYNYGSYNDAFTWDQGSIGWDLDSGALFDTRSGVWWGPGAIAKGVTVTSGPATEPYLEGLARPNVVRNLLEGANVGDAFLRNTRWIKWMILNVGDPLYQPFPGGVAPFNAAVPANSLEIYATQNTFRQFVGASPLGIKVSLAAPAPGGGLTMALSTNASGLSIPSSITIPAGQSSAIVTGSTLSVTVPVDVQVTASAGSITASNTVSLYPLLSGAGFANNPAKGGVALKGFVNLYGNAPVGGATVQLISDNPGVLAVPSTVTVLQGLSQVTFTVTPSVVAANTDVHIASSYAGSSNTFTLTITP